MAIEHYLHLKTDKTLQQLADSVYKLSETVEPTQNYIYHEDTHIYLLLPTFRVTVFSTHKIKRSKRSEEISLKLYGFIPNKWIIFRRIPLTGYNPSDLDVLKNIALHYITQSDTTLALHIYHDLGVIKRSQDSLITVSPKWFSSEERDELSFEFEISEF